MDDLSSTGLRLDISELRWSLGKCLGGNRIYATSLIYCKHLRMLNKNILWNHLWMLKNKFQMFLETFSFECCWKVRIWTQSHQYKDSTGASLPYLRPATQLRHPPPLTWHKRHRNDVFISLWTQFVFENKRSQERGGGISKVAMEPGSVPDIYFCIYIFAAAAKG